MTNIIEKKGNILDSEMECIVNTVNCVGVMGRGLALQFKHKYPNMYEDYRNKCLNKQIKLGEVYLYEDTSSKKIINFPTKNHWKNKSNIEDIENGLINLCDKIDKFGITSISIPPLGCGLGGLNWDDVYPLIIKYMTDLNIQVEIYLP